MASSELKPGKICRLCNKHIEGHLFGSDFTCRTCQSECRRAEPIYRELAATHNATQRENALAIKTIREELADLKNMLSSRQQKASTTLKGVKDELSQLQAEVTALRTVHKKQASGGDSESLKKVEKGLEEVRKDVKGLDQEMANLYAAQQDDKKWHNAVAVEEVRDALEGLEDFTSRLKDAFVSLAGPETKKKKAEEEEREKANKELVEGVKEMQAFMKQMQQAFSMFPTAVQEKPKVNGVVNGAKT